MGEVWRARDTRLLREVAVKVLPEGIREDPERLARFQREARAASRISDPHVVSVFDVGQESATAFLVTELVDGPDLRSEMAAGPLPVERALDLAAQIAEGLAAAHEAGIVHRDLKPENVFVTRSGTAKVGDFGLAKARDVEPQSGERTAATVSLASTPGAVMGTVGYMSPEQVRGQSLDHRSDIFSLGSLIYEMLTGVRPFGAGGSAETMAAILKEEPPNPSSLNPSVPPALDRVVLHCLTKRAERRFQSARDLAFALSSLTAAPAGAALLAGPVAGATRSVVPLPQGTRLSGQASPGLAISRDGTRLACVVQSEEKPPNLCVIHLGRGETQMIPDSEYAEGPFFSPDGQWVAFAADVKPESPRPGELRKHSFASGLTQAVCPLTGYEGACWGENDAIYFVGDVLQGLRRIPLAGGGRELATVTQFRVGETEGPRCIGYPRLLPGEQAAVVLDWDASPLGDTSILDLASGQLRPLADSASAGVLAKTGHLLYTKTDGTLFAVPFDRARGVSIGPPVAVVRDVALDGAGGVFAVSETGTLAFARGQLRGSVYEKKRLVALGLDGEAEPMAVPADVFSPWIGVSRDGRRLVVSSRLTGLWVADLRRGTRARMPAGRARLARYPVLTPDAEWIAFRGAVVGEMGFKILRQKADGSGPPEALFDPDASERRPRGFSRDGESLFYEAVGGEAERGLWSLSLDAPRTPVRRVAGAIEESSISPDGGFVVYQSGEFGSVEVFVQRLDESAPRSQVSVGGGRCPRWSADGRQVFFLAGDRLHAAPFDGSGAEPDCGPAQPLFERAGIEGYEVAPDGRGFLAVERLPDAGLVRQIELVTGWFAELERLAPKR